MKEIEKLYMLYKDDIYRYLLSLTRNPVLSEDLLSETFINAITSIQRFKGQSSIKTWLFGIARNIWLQNIQKDRYTVEYCDLLRLYISDSVDERLVSIEKLDRIKRLLSQKDRRTQQIVGMRIQGYSFAEIAERVGIRENSARVIDFRTKRWIKDMLDEEGLS